MSCCASCSVGRLCDGPTMGALAGFEAACLTKWPGDVANDRARVQGLMLATDEAISSCRNITNAERVAWAAFRSGWDAFYAKPLSWVLGAGNECALTMQYERDVMAWQAQIRGRCDVPGPDPNATQGDGGTLVKWVVVGVVAVAGALVVRTVLR